MTSNKTQNTKENEKDFLNKVLFYSSEILDIFYHQDEFTTSDLQGAIEAQVSKMLKDNNY
jgi:hypothetical protein